jgi:signal transduction histidine kinase
VRSDASYREHMRFVRTLGWGLEPVIGAVFLLLWIVAEVGRGVTGVGAMAAFAVAIGCARRLPALSLAILPATILLQAVGVIARPDSTDWPVYLGIALTVGLVTAHATRPVSVWALIVGVASAIGALTLMVANGWFSWTGRGDAAFQIATLSPRLVEYLQLVGIAVLIVALAWGAGLALNLSGRLALARLVQGGMAGRLRESEVELAVAQERNRIAQEMHDVLAHSLAVIVAQADGARYVRKTRPSAVDSSLEAIADSARAALVDVRGIIDGILEGAAPPQPGIDDLPELVESVESAGLEITVTHAGRGDGHGPVGLAPGQQLALYRIVQECLTNALRHRGRGSAVSIVLDWRGPGVSLQFVSSGQLVTPIEGDDDARQHRGIEGMRERAHLAGGWLAAGADESGSHRVTAFVPYRLPIGVPTALPVLAAAAA